MAGGKGKASSNASRLRKRVEVESASSSSSLPSLKRARDGSAFVKCEECNDSVHVALIKFHDCTLDAKIKASLEAQVVEMQAEPKKKSTAEKKTSRKAEPKAKKTGDTNKRKRPPTAFFVFMDEFRKTFKEANPQCKSVATVAKEGGEKWKSLTEEEKKVYQDRAAELKAEFLKALESDDKEENEEAEDEKNEATKETEDEKEEVEDAKEITEENNETEDIEDEEE